MTYYRPRLGRGSIKLCRAQVLELRRLATSQPRRYTQRRLAELYHVSQCMVSRIASGKAWRGL